MLLNQFPIQNVDETYLEDIEAIMKTGTVRPNRTGIDTCSVFGVVQSFDLRGGRLPLLSSKEIKLRSIIHELIWMISGSTNIEYLKRNNVSIWDSWIDPTTAKYDATGKLIAGDIGPGYGAQWRAWEDYKVLQSPTPKDLLVAEQQGYHVYAELPHFQVLLHRKIDQLSTVVDQLKNDPNNRRIIVSAWNVGRIDQMQLPPCHAFFQFYTRELTLPELQAQYAEATGESLEGDLAQAQAITVRAELPTRSLSCSLYQRSADKPLGVCFNWVQYALLVNLIARDVNMAPERLNWIGGDTHIYSNQNAGIEEHLSRKENMDRYRTQNPRVVIKHRRSLFDYTADDIQIVDYYPDSHIFMPVAV